MFCSPRWLYFISAFSIASLLLLTNVNFGTTSLALKQLQEDESYFQAWIIKFKKSYNSNEEYEQRFQTFRDNLAIIKIHNQQDLGFTLAVNKFADLSFVEFSELISRPLPILKDRKEIFLNVETLPFSVDWRKSGAVTPVKTQGQCGSCWSFSTTGSVEGINAISSGVLTSLSEQQLIDCSTSFGNQGCDGGVMDSAFQYIIATGGLNTEEDYPYTATDGNCTANTTNLFASISGFVDVPSKNNIQLQAAVAQQPVSISIQANQYAFQFYSSGIIKSGCGTMLDHGVLIVGYDIDIIGDVPYWIIKNSWGSGWGQDGYAFILRSTSTSNSGVCGVALDASYPTK